MSQNRLPAFGLQPGWDEVHLTRLASDDETASFCSSTFEMPSSSLHDPSDPPVTEGLVGSERTFLHWTFELQFEAFHEPVHFQMDAGIYEIIEIARCVLQC